MFAAEWILGSCVCVQRMQMRQDECRWRQSENSSLWCELRSDVRQRSWLFFHSCHTVKVEVKTFVLKASCWSFVFVGGEEVQLVLLLVTVMLCGRATRFSFTFLCVHIFNQLCFRFATLLSMLPIYYVMWGWTSEWKVIVQVGARDYWVEWIYTSGLMF